MTPDIEIQRICLSKPSPLQMRALAVLKVAGQVVEVELNITDLSINFGSYVHHYDFDRVSTAIAVFAHENQVKPPLDMDELLRLTKELGSITGSLFALSDSGDSYILTERSADRQAPAKVVFQCDDILDAWAKLKARFAVAQILQEASL
jgi:hypothetical protein